MHEFISFFEVRMIQEFCHRSYKFGDWWTLLMSFIKWGRSEPNSSSLFKRWILYVPSNLRPLILNLNAFSSSSDSSARIRIPPLRRPFPSSPLLLYRRVPAAAMILAIPLRLGNRSISGRECTIPRSPPLCGKLGWVSSRGCSILLKMHLRRANCSRKRRRRVGLLWFIISLLISFWESSIEIRGMRLESESCLKILMPWLVPSPLEYVDFFVVLDFYSADWSAYPDIDNEYVMILWTQWLTECDFLNLILIFF